MTNIWKKARTRQIAALLILFNVTVTKAQMITGVWSGRINRQKVEIKIIQEGDSLTGSSYYYESPNNYRRYSIKGYFNSETNAAVWWDDQLIEERSPKFSLTAPGKNALLSSADFNCPGSGEVLLDGKASLRDETSQPKGEVHLDKTNATNFEDEWDFVIENYTSGANDPDIIDSVAEVVRLVGTQTTGQTVKTPTTVTPPIDQEVKTPPPIVVKAAPPIAKQPVAEQVVAPPVVRVAIPPTVTPPVVPTIVEKYTSRKNILTTEIPVSGDSIELRFYDNAEIDGDSISLFLNDKLIFEHIRLAATAYTIKISVKDLKESNDLIMVAENLGSIPPNTSYMVALVGDKRYDARLESTEGTSAMIRLTKVP